LEIFEMVESLKIFRTLENIKNIYSIWLNH
jgi:hypothetical protein